MYIYIHIYVYMYMCYIYFEFIFKALLYLNKLILICKINSMSF